MDPPQPVGRKKASPARSDSTSAPIPSSPRSARSQSAIGPPGVGRDQRQLGAARECLAQAHPGTHPVRLGGAGGLADQLPRPGSGARAAGSRSSSRRSPQAAIRAKRGTRAQTTVIRTYVRISSGKVKARA